MEIELNEMLLVYIEGSLIENIIIQEDKLLFSDVDSENNTVYKTVPVNEYEEGTDKYLAAESEVFKANLYKSFFSSFKYSTSSLSLLFSLIKLVITTE